MHTTVAARIRKRIGYKGRGWVFSPKDFLDLGARSNVDFVLHKLTDTQTIRRISAGIYDFPVKHPKLGALSPSTDNILRAVSAKTGEVIQPSGADSANWLGLSTQVPAKPYYLTSGRSRLVNVGNEDIRLKHTSVQPLHGKSDKVSLLVQALLYIGKQHIDYRAVQICTKQLSAKQKNDLRHMARYVPEWLTPVIHNIVA